MGCEVAGCEVRGAGYEVWGSEVFSPLLVPEQVRATDRP